MSNQLEHARQPNTLITGICMDCGPAESVGVRRFLTETGHCATCGSAATMMPNAVREVKRQLHERQMERVRVKKQKRRGQRG